MSHAKQKEIVDAFPEVEASSATLRGSRFEGVSSASWQKKMLVVFLNACTLPQNVLARLFGVSKTCIHTWNYEVCGEEFDWRMLRELVGWSGRVSVDEKWVKIAGQSQESAKVLLRSLWLKEVLLNGQPHVEVSQYVKHLSTTPWYRESSALFP